MDKQVVSTQFNISEPMRAHYVLEVKGIKFTISIKELVFLKDLLQVFLKDK